jgi:hypothetical protein
MFSWIKNKRRARREFWEGLCHQCGLCCYERRVRAGGKLEILWGRPCEHLDTATHRCTVYHRRFRVCRYCAKVTILHALFSRALPASCGYVEHYRPRYAARRRLADEQTGD